MNNPFGLEKAGWLFIFLMSRKIKMIIRINLRELTKS